MSAGANPSVRQERDRVPAGPVYGFAAFLIEVLIAGWFFTWLSERHAPVHIGIRRKDAKVTVLPREIQMIDQTLFSAHLPSRGDWEAKRRALESYSWADSSHRTIRIPIDRAIDMLVQRGHVQ